MTDALSGDKSDQVIHLLEKIASASLQQDNDLDELKSKFADLTRRMDKVDSHLERLVRSHDGDERRKPLLERLVEIEMSIEQFEGKSKEETKRLDLRITNLKKDRQNDRRWFFSIVASLIVMFIGILAKIAIDHAGK